MTLLTLTAAEHLNFVMAPNWPKENADPGNNATFEAFGLTIGSPYYRTEFGAHENSESPYDTFDQGGNVWEWNEAILYGSSRGLRGGSFYKYYDDDLRASFRDYYDPAVECYVVGFRVASIPEPLLGDVNLDGEVNGLDVDPFVEVLLAGQFDAAADMNEDSAVNGLDVDPFVDAILSGGVQPVPEPSTLLLLATLALGLLCWRRKER